MTRKQAIIEQREAHQRRLDELLVRQATFGYQTPVEISTEIDEIYIQLAKLDASIVALETVDELSDSTRIVAPMDRRSHEQRLDIMVATVMATVAEVSSIKKYVTDAITEQNKKIFRFVVGGVVFLTLLLVLIKTLG